MQRARATMGRAGALCLDRGALLPPVPFHPIPAAPIVGPVLGPPGAIGAIRHDPFMSLDDRRQPALMPDAAVRRGHFVRLHRARARERT